MCRHVVAYGHAMWHHVGIHACVWGCVCALVYVHVCARVRACVCTYVSRMTREMKFPFQDNAISQCH